MQRYFYASSTDLVAVIEAVHAKLTVAYTPMGMFREPPSTFVDLAPLVAANSVNPGASYLVSLQGEKVAVRDVTQTSRDIFRAIDQLLNPDTIELTPSTWHSADLAIRGRIATTSHTAPSKQLYGAFALAIERTFRHVGSAWVGPDAEVAWRNGARLAIGSDSPREYDLVESRLDAV